MRKSTFVLAAVIFRIAGLFGGHFYSNSAAQERVPATMKWEYRILDSQTFTRQDELQAEFNKLGESGWELVTAHHNSSFNQYVMKRAKR